MQPLSHNELEVALADLPDWKVEDSALCKTIKFSSFRAAMAFLVRTAFEAEEMNHHPDWSNVYNQVTVRLTTHDAGSEVTEKDVKLARKIEQILAG